jgi:hypothetical protein
MTSMAHASHQPKPAPSVPGALCVVAVAQAPVQLVPVVAVAQQAKLTAGRLTVRFITVAGDHVGKRLRGARTAAMDYASHQRKPLPSRRTMAVVTSPREVGNGRPHADALLGQPFVDPSDNNFTSTFWHLVAQERVCAPCTSATSTEFWRQTPHTAFIDRVPRVCDTKKKSDP